MANRKEKYVRQAECDGAMSRVSADINTIKRALVGDDMRSGLVKEISIISSKVDVIVTDRQHASEVSARWKLAIFGAAVSSAIAMVGFIVKAVGG